MLAFSIYCSNAGTVAVSCSVVGGACEYGKRLDTESSFVPHTCKCESMTFGFVMEMAVVNDLLLLLLLLLLVVVSWDDDDDDDRNATALVMTGTGLFDDVDAQLPMK